MSVSHGRPAEARPFCRKISSRRWRRCGVRRGSRRRSRRLVLVVLKGVRGLGWPPSSTYSKARDHELRAQKLPCPKCGVLMRRDKSRRAVTRMTLLGKVTYRRTSFCCRGCGHREFPLDEQLALKALLRGHSDEFAKDVVLFCTLMPSARAVTCSRGATGS